MRVRSSSSFPFLLYQLPLRREREGGNPSKRATQESELDAQSDVPLSESETRLAPKAKKLAAKKGTKGRKASSTRSSKATITASPPPSQTSPEDLARDEREIEAELQRMAFEQAAIHAEQERTAEFEPSPSHAQKHVDQIRHLEEELQAEIQGFQGLPGKNMVGYIAKVAFSPPHAAAVASVVGEEGRGGTTPSPSGSDKENQPSSIPQAQESYEATAPRASRTPPLTNQNLPYTLSARNTQPRLPLQTPAPFAN